jgi:hypothetical protein
MFGPNRDEVIGGWRKLRNEELHDWCCSPHILWVKKLRRKRRLGYEACMEENRNVYRGLVETSEEKKPLGRPVSRWEDKGILRQHAERVCVRLKATC